MDLFLISIFMLGMFIGWLITEGATCEKYHLLRKTEWICTKSEIVGDTFPKTEVATQWTKKGTV